MGEVFAKAVDVHDPSLETGYIVGVDWDGKGLSGSSRGRHRWQIRSNTFGEVAPTLHFAGHYREPPIRVSVDLSSEAAVDVMLVFDPYGLSWTIASQQNIPDAKPSAPKDADSWRIPDYGPSHRRYCIEAVMKHRSCGEKEAAVIVAKRTRAAIQEARTSKPIREARQVV